LPSIVAFDVFCTLSYFLLLVFVVLCGYLCLWIILLFLFILRSHAYLLIFFGLNRLYFPTFHFPIKIYGARTFCIDCTIIIILDIYFATGIIFVTITTFLIWHGSSQQIENRLPHVSICVDCHLLHSGVSFFRRTKYGPWPIVHALQSASNAYVPFTKY